MDLLEKKQNAWITHVEQYQLLNNCTYATALKESKATYKKGEIACGEVVDIKSFANPTESENVKPVKTRKPRKSKSTEESEVKSLKVLKPRKSKSVKLPIETDSKIEI